VELRPPGEGPLRRFCNTLCVSFLILLGTNLLSSEIQAQTAVADRITQPIEQGSTSPITGSVHPLTRAATDEGLVDNAKTLAGVTINFRRTEAQEASLQALLQAQQTPGSPSYHLWLTPAQFGQQFGVSSADLAKVSAWLQQEGFTVNAVPQSSNSISFTGNVAVAERAFQTQIHSYSLNGEKHFANATNISIPAALSGIVSSVRGLDDFRPKAKVQFPRKTAAATNAHFTSGVSGDHFIAPGDFAVIYDVNPLYTAGFTGKGLTIAVMGQVDIVPADITDFRAAAGLSVNNPTVVTVPGSTPETVADDEAGGFDDLVETDLDLEWSGGVATGASIILVNSGDVFSSLQYAIQNQINGITIPIISQSYGACESSVPTADLTTYESWLAQANSQGQTVVLAAGDTGAADCDDSTPPETVATQGLAVDYPGSSVYVTDAGGSEFMGDGTDQSPSTGSDQYWSANGSNDVLTSAKSYIPEMVWNDTTYEITNGVGGLSAGGGGASQLWNKPSWQTGVPGIPADGKRDVPDISLNASPVHDSSLYCTQIQTVGGGGAWSSSCQATSFRISDPGQSDDQGLTAAGGTSFAAPSFAGLLAVIEQKTGATLGLGNINPALYSLAANATTYASAFHDITTGNNEVPCATGSSNCPTSGTLVIGYAAGTGYDQASGLGSVDANNLATAFASATFSIATTTKLVVAPASPAVGANITLTATVAAASGTTVPGGTVTFYIDGVLAQTVTLAAGVATTTPTSFSTGGTHNVQAVYSGATGFFVSQSAVTTVTVIASGVAKTTTTLTANPTTVALDGALTLTAAVQSATAGTLAGNVTFTIGSTTVGTAAITPGASGAGSATLSVSSATTALGFAVGANTVVATYGGDADYASSSGNATVTVTNPGITIAATNVTISSASPGNSGTSTITLTSTGAYTGTAVVSASGTVNVSATFPNGATGSVALSSGGTGTTTLTLTTVAANGSVQKSLAGSKLAGRVGAAGGTIAGCILLLLVPGIRRKRWPVALIMLVFLSVGAGIGCGGGTGGGAPSGSYTVTVTATDSSNSNITATGTFTLTIQ
jgi:Pro-kumamolisin, activation domain/Bacterial Ig-like domain (group 3)